MPPLSYFIIVYKPSGYVLPARPARQGFTHDAATVAAENHLPLGPRLFRSEKNARNALRSYCLGPWHAYVESDSYQGIIGQSFGPTGKERRNIFDYEIVPLEMKW